MTRTLTPREQARERTMAEIMRIARDQLVAEGPAALSLRAVARQLGIVSSAIYRYVSSRDELLTLLIVEAYSDLGGQVEKAVAAAPAHPLERFTALARAVRSWALDDAARYALLFGTPVPGYA
ncbi:MAG: TetR/AcrR family transcriptional regulator, partial [Micrococcaceae bacterium]|nr:TetR/AcrR family transcriptional regulator [Micrococcaceae bacterium]